MAKTIDSGSVFELEIERDSGERDALILCAACRPTVDDYATIVKSSPVAGRCERCGGDGRPVAPCGCRILVDGSWQCSGSARCRCDCHGVK